MTKNKAEPSDREVILANPAKLREIAALIHECATAYEEQATRMEENQIESIKYGGFKTIRERVIKLARGNASTIAVEIQAEIDAKRMDAISEKKENYVPSTTQRPKPKDK